MTDFRMPPIRITGMHKAHGVSMALRLLRRINGGGHDFSMRHR